MEGFPSGQRDQTVNLTAQPSKVRILLPPPSLSLTQIIIFKYQTWPMFGSVLKVRKFVEGFPSGQRDQTVNLTAQPSKVRILLPPPFLSLSIPILFNFRFVYYSFICHSFIYSFCSNYILCIKLHFYLKPSF